jgi:hypothetical protein
MTTSLMKILVLSMLAVLGTAVCQMANAQVRTTNINPHAQAAELKTTTQQTGESVSGDAAAIDPTNPATPEVQA